MKQFRKLTWAVIASMSLFSACSNVDDEEEDGPKDPTTEVGTEANPYSVAQLMELPYGSNSDTIARGVWVEAYIVGNIEQVPMESDPSKTENVAKFDVSKLRLKTSTEYFLKVESQNNKPEIIRVIKN